MITIPLHKFWNQLPEMCAWITLQEGVDFVLKNFERMLCGELFVPKIPPMRIVDVARAMAMDIPQKMIGIRPGEKLHDIMCLSDDSHLTSEFEDHFVIQPTITFTSCNNCFTENVLGEIGQRVEQGFEYNSGTNEHFLPNEAILEYNERAGA